MKSCYIQLQIITTNVLYNHVNTYQVYNKYYESYLLQFKQNPPFFFVYYSQNIYILCGSVKVSNYIIIAFYKIFYSGYPNAFSTIFSNIFY